MQALCTVVRAVMLEGPFIVPASLPRVAVHCLGGAPPPPPPGRGAPPPPPPPPHPTLLPHPTPPHPLPILKQSNHPTHFPAVVPLLPRRRQHALPLPAASPGPAQQQQHREQRQHWLQRRRHQQHQRQHGDCIRLGAAANGVFVRVAPVFSCPTLLAVLLPSAYALLSEGSSVLITSFLSFGSHIC